MPNRYLKPFVGTPHENDTVKLLGIRGFYEDLGDPHKNDLGIYDDLVVRCIGQDTIGFRANVDPGWFWIEHPMNSEGCAMLPEGSYEFKLGLHKKIHPALVPASEFKVWRLDDQGNKRGEGVASDIEVHSGGAGMDVRKFSAACQVIQSPEGFFGATWLKFFDPLAHAMKLHQQPRVNYLLIRREDLE